MNKIILLTLLTLSGCGGGIFDTSCDEDRDQTVAGSGQPEEVDKFDSGDYHSWTYWYWAKGFSRTFTWGGPLDSCQTSDYTFTPIRSTQ